VLLKGRKEGEGYVHVLCTELADMVRTTPIRKY
jgi:hypothetical protein